jgi:spore coat polysaccharide biosynthesis predicted glycosyltransferase SpsG
MTPWKPVCFFRTDGDEQVGMGHVHRCLALARKMARIGFKPHFFLKHASNATEGLLESHGMPVTRVARHNNWPHEARWLIGQPGMIEAVVILDVSHSLSVSDLDGFAAYTEILKRHCRLLTLLDGMGRTALFARLALSVDLLLTPYVGASSISPNGEKGFTHLAGPRYMIFQPEFDPLDSSPRPISDDADRVLVTFGGADPKGMTRFTLDALGGIRDRSLKIRAVVGPSFSAELTAFVERLAGSLCHDVYLVRAPLTLASEMRWCDIAVCNSGLTKYELALTGTPSIMLSHDEEHAQINKAFGALKTGWDLGVFSSISVQRLNRAVLDLLDNAPARRRMSLAGRELVDHRGADLIISKIKEVLSC